LDTSPFAEKYPKFPCLNFGVQSTFICVEKPPRRNRFYWTVQ
jgi:hypothetical protein